MGGAGRVQFGADQARRGRRSWRQEPQRRGPGATISVAARIDLAVERTPAVGVEPQLLGVAAPIAVLVEPGRLARPASRAGSAASSRRGGASTSRNFRPSPRRPERLACRTAGACSVVAMHQEPTPTARGAVVHRWRQAHRPAATGRARRPITVRTTAPARVRPTRHAVEDAQPCARSGPGSVARTKAPRPNMKPRIGGGAGRRVQRHLQRRAQLDRGLGLARPRARTASSVQPRAHAEVEGQDVGLARGDDAEQRQACRRRRRAARSSTSRTVPSPPSITTRSHAGAGRRRMILGQRRRRLRLGHSSTSARGAVAGASRRLAWLCGLRMTPTRISATARTPSCRAASSAACRIWTACTTRQIAVQTATSSKPMSGRPTRQRAGQQDQVRIAPRGDQPEEAVERPPGVHLHLEAGA